MRFASAQACWFWMRKLRPHERKRLTRYRRVMRYLRRTCPACDTATSYALEDSETFVECPTCGQRNTIPPGTNPLSGRCGKCNYPLDSHEWYDDMIVKCPSSGVKP